MHRGLRSWALLNVGLGLDLTQLDSLETPQERARLWAPIVRAVRQMYILYMNANVLFVTTGYDITFISFTIKL